MEKLLDQNIRDVIARYPGVAGVLEGYRIACTSCQVGTCRLRDVVEIHSLSEADERILFTEIARIVHPGEEVEIPRLVRKPAAPAGKKLSPAVRLMVDEHVRIKKVIAAVPGLVDRLEDSFAERKETLRGVVEFVRKYADKFHHAKEEDLLFNLFETESELVPSMLKEHELGRSYIREAVGGIDTGNPELVRKNLLLYGELLSGHIAKEDDIIYPWMDRRLTDSQVGRIYSRSMEIAGEFGPEAGRLESFADRLYETYAPGARTGG